MAAVAIRAQGLGKSYRIRHLLGAAPYRTVREDLAALVRQPFRKGNGRKEQETFWALREVTFDVPRGEVLGIIGRNGAGKSTLLKILSRITEPSRGYADVYGRVGSLLEVGTGFHPELTGRENVFLNGALLGMRRTEIARSFDAIVSFAEIEAFLDTPVKHYSSGMYTRLAFAVAAHLEAEILLVDEVLAVGDTAFRRKCVGKMGEVAGEGRTVLLVSHDMAAVEGICRTAFLLEKGRIAKTGDAREVVAAYLASLPASGGMPLEQRPDREGNGRLRFTEVGFRVGGSPTDNVQCGQDVEIVASYEGKAGPLQNVSAAFTLYTLGGQCMLQLHTQLVGADFDQVPPKGRIACQVKRFPLAPGQYFLNLYCETNGVLSDWIQQAVLLTVEGGDFYGTGRLPPRSHGGVLVPQEWSVEG